MFERQKTQNWIDYESSPHFCTYTASRLSAAQLSSSQRHLSAASTLSLSLSRTPKQ